MRLEGNSLEVALLSQQKVGTRIALVPNRREAVAIVGIVVVQAAAVPRVAITHIVTVTRVRGPERNNDTTRRRHM